MKKMLMALFCAAMFLGGLRVALAQPPPPRAWHYDELRGSVRERIHHAEERIERGIEHGSITRHEARKLLGELHGIRDRIDHMRRDDGRLDPRERDAIHHNLDRLERHITWEKRDADRSRPRHDGPPPPWGPPPPRPY